ncbi:MAG: DUF4351 domain-containing protein [Myxococcota bacterium]
MDRRLVDDHGAALMAVSYEHESLLELFRRRETLAVELLTGSLGVEVPSWSEVRVTEGDLGQIDPVETRADLVLLLDENGKAVFGIVVEVQLAKNAEKLFRWPLYAATLRVRHACPVAVLVVTPDRTVAEWAKKPIALGSGNTYSVAVLGPDAVPRIETPDVPVELALLSAKAHGETDEGLIVVENALRCVMQLDADERSDYHDLLWAWLSPAIREKVSEMLEQHFPYPQSDFAKEHYGKGLREGEAQLLLRLLTHRFGELPAEVETRVRAADDGSLQRWGVRLLDATSLDAVFADD